MNGTFQSFVSQNVRAFDTKHGKNSVLNGWIYFEDGAVRENDLLGRLIDPPEDEYEKLKNIIHYHRGRLAKAVSEFDQFNESLQMQESVAPEQLDELKKLKKVADTINADVEQAKKNLTNTERGMELASHRRYDDELKQRNAESHAKRKKITRPSTANL